MSKRKPQTKLPIAPKWCAMRHMDRQFSLYSWRRAAWYIPSQLRLEVILFQKKFAAFEQVKCFGDILSLCIQRSEQTSQNKLSARRGGISLEKTRFLCSRAHHYRLSLFFMAARAIVRVYLTSNKSRPHAEREKGWAEAGKEARIQTHCDASSAFGCPVPFARVAVLPSSTPSPQRWREANETGAPRRVIESGL